MGCGLGEMDALNFIEGLHNESIDIFITSPPYNLKNKGGDVKINTYADKWDNEYYQDGQTKILKAMGKKLKPKGAIFYNHKNRYENNQVITPGKWVLDSNLKINQCIIWDRITSVDNNRSKFKPTTELVFGLYKDKTFKLKQEAVNFNEVGKIKRPTSKMNLGHKATFPPNLIERILISLDTNLTKLTICDPFAGTGTVAQVAQYLKVKWVGLNDLYLNGNQIKEKVKMTGEHEKLPIIKNKYKPQEK